MLTATETAVWAEWNRLGNHPAPVKQIAATLGMTAADVAFIVYPAETFGRWADDQEPELGDEGERIVTDEDFHKLYPDEFHDALVTAGGAYMGHKAATGSHHEALIAAVQEAFNAGVKVGRETV